MGAKMNSERDKKLTIAKIAYKQIISAMEDAQKNSEFEIGFCWDECLWVDDEFFQYSEMKEDYSDRGLNG